MSNIDDAKKFIYARGGKYFGTTTTDGLEYIQYTCPKGHKNSACLSICYFKEWCQYCYTQSSRSKIDKFKERFGIKKEEFREKIIYRDYVEPPPLPPPLPALPESSPLPPTKNFSRPKKVRKKVRAKTIILEAQPPPPPPPPPPTFEEASFQKSSHPLIDIDELRQKRETLNALPKKTVSMVRKLTSSKKS